MKINQYQFFKKYLWLINIFLYILCISSLLLFSKINISLKILAPVFVVMVVTPLVFKNFWVQVFYFCCYLIFLGYILLSYLP